MKGNEKDMRKFEVNITEEQEQFIIDSMNYFGIETEEEVVQLMIEGSIFAMNNYRKFLYNFFRDRKEMLDEISKENSKTKEAVQKERSFVEKFKGYIEG